MDGYDKTIYHQGMVILSKYHVRDEVMNWQAAKEILPQELSHKSQQSHQQIYNKNSQQHG